MSIISKLPARSRVGWGIFLIVACAQGALLEQKPIGAVNDFAGILSRNARDSLAAVSESLFKKIGVVLVVVTTPTLEGYAIEEMANKLFEKWGIGKKGTDEGVLVLLAVEERSVRIETGYGAERYLTDVQSKRIIRDAAASYLSNNQWGAGVGLIVAEVAALSAEAHAIPLQEIAGVKEGVPSASTRRVSPPNGLSVILFVALLIFLCSTRIGRSILFMLIVSSLFSGNRSGYRTSGFGGGFGRSGGFGGFGGGMSGGGGASGRF
jgi:uncharacterized protein